MIIATDEDDDADEEMAVVRRDMLLHKTLVKSHHSAQVLCDYPHSWGPDFYSSSEEMFCHMATKTLIPGCKSKKHTIRTGHGDTALSSEDATLDIRAEDVGAGDFEVEDSEAEDTDAEGTDTEDEEFEDIDSDDTGVEDAGDCFDPDIGRMRVTNKTIHARAALVASKSYDIVEDWHQDPEQDSGSWF